MSCRPWCPLVLAGLLLTAVGSCSDGDDKTNPVQPVNHNPVISSATIFPLSIGPSDSAIAICSAVDPDGDSLYYDWIGDTRVRLKGTGGGSYLFDSPLNYQVFYYGTPPGSARYCLHQVLYSRSQRRVSGNAPSTPTSSIEEGGLCLSEELAHQLILQSRAARAVLFCRRSSCRRACRGTDPVQSCHGLFMAFTRA